ncbi:DNA endonuclease SmrA [Psychrosphaera sp.]|nr:DNA endonuclease SmrA [Psychrosphaera sp.]
MNEFSSFIDELGDVKPIKQSKTNRPLPCSNVSAQTLSLRRANAQLPSSGDQNPLTTESVELIAPDDILSFKKDGVQQGVFKNLRLGKYEIHTVLNLHGKTINEARTELFKFTNDAHKQNLRCILIQHGKGLQSKPHQALLKSYVNKWLTQLPMALAFHSAQPFHGGSASTYLLMKKSEESRLDNKEKHQKRGANF